MDSDLWVRQSSVRIDEGGCSSVHTDVSRVPAHWTCTGHTLYIGHHGGSCLALLGPLLCGMVTWFHRCLTKLHCSGHLVHEASCASDCTSLDIRTCRGCHPTLVLDRSLIKGLARLGVLFTLICFTYFNPVRCSYPDGWEAADAAHFCFVCLVHNNVKNRKSYMDSQRLVAQLPAASRPRETFREKRSRVLPTRDVSGAKQ